jgi:hypothetical protein
VSTEAMIMFVIGALILWGGLAVSVAYYVRSSRRDPG